MDDLTLDDFMRWKIEALREYLTKRGLSKDGNKNELASLCYAANVMKMPLTPSYSQIILENKKDYKQLLNIDGFSIPDPLRLFSGWLDEKSGLAHWPPIYISDIINFMVNRDSKGTIQTHLNDYKIGKAYEYFHAGFLKEVYIHKIDSDSTICILRAKCTPSLRITDDFHDVWVCCEKKTGEIKSAYCSCTAGLGSTCNHIAGLLFRVESANKLGATSSTSLPCTWKVPSGTTDLGPAKLKDTIIQKSRHGKQDKRRNLSLATFKPVSNIDKSDVLKTFVTELKDVLPNACLFKGFEKEETGMPHTPTVDKDINKEKINPSQYTIGYLTSLHSEPKTFLQNLPVYSSVEVQHLSESSVGQWKNPTWHLLRKDRLTASNFYNIHTRVVSCSSKQETNFKHIMSKVLGYTSPNPAIKALKHGRESEPYAKKQYVMEMRKTHTDFETTECGLFIDKNYVYLGASPDLLVNCSCCGEGLVEIKCPIVAKCEKCSDFCFCSPPKCLQLSQNGTVSLKTNHPYYGQIMGQLAISNRAYCDFFIYTCNGTFRQRILFSENYYAPILESLKYFYVCVADELYSRKLQHSVLDATLVQQEEPMELQTTYFCPVCKRVIKEPENIKTFQDQSISCDKCELWYHFKCVGLTKVKAKNTKQWLCKQCSD